MLSYFKCVTVCANGCTGIEQKSSKQVTYHPCMDGCVRYAFDFAILSSGLPYPMGSRPYLRKF